MTATDRDGVALLKAIKAHPDEDTPRLMYADWLQERGQDDRAEFIRLQCELARTPRWAGECDVCGATPDDEGSLNHGRGCYVLDADGGGSEAADENPDWPALRRRERELWGYRPTRGGILDAVKDTLPDGWAAILGTDPRYGLTDEYPWAVVRRGFVEAVRCDWPAWRDHGDAVLAAHPVRELTLTSEPELELFLAGEWADGGRPVYKHRLLGVPGCPPLQRLAGTDRALARQLVGLRWPGVKVAIDVPDAGYVDALRRLPPPAGYVTSHCTRCAGPLADPPAGDRHVLGDEVLCVGCFDRELSRLRAAPAGAGPGGTLRVGDGPPIPITGWTLNPDARLNDADFPDPPG